jgi:hypothetical protein
VNGKASVDFTPHCGFQVAYRGASRARRKRWPKTPFPGRCANGRQLTALSKFNANETSESTPVAV